MATEASPFINTKTMAAMDASQWPTLSEIDPEFKAIIESTDVDAPPMRDPAQIAAMRPVMEQMQMNMPYQTSIDRSGVIEDTIDIPFRDGYSLPAALYKPSQTPASPGPLVVLYHGGGFIVGFPGQEITTAVHLVKTYNATVFSVKYRLAPEHQFPQHVNDCWDALKWISSNAASLSADPSKGFLLGGTSAGGNLAAVISHLARDSNLTPPLTGITLAYPATVSQDSIPSSFSSEYTSHVQNANAPGMLNADSIAFMRKCYNPDVTSGSYSVLNWENGHKGLPKTHILVCGLDPLRDDGLLYARELEKAGVDVKLDVYKGVPHGFDIFYPDMTAAKKFRKDREEAFAWMLNGGKK